MQEGIAGLGESSGDQVAFGEAETGTGDHLAVGVLGDQLLEERVGLFEVSHVGVHAGPLVEQDIAVLGLGELLEECRVGRVGACGFLVQCEQSRGPPCGQKCEGALGIVPGSHPVCLGRFLGRPGLLVTLRGLVGGLCSQFVFWMQGDDPAKQGGRFVIFLGFKQAPASSRESCGVEGRFRSQCDQAAEESVGSFVVLRRVSRLGHPADRLGVDGLVAEAVGQTGQGEVRGRCPALAFR